MPHFNSPNATPQQFKRHTSMAQMNGIAEAKVWHLTCNSVALYKRSFSQQKEENNFILSYTNLHFHPINSIFSLKTRIYALSHVLHIFLLLNLYNIQVVKDINIFLYLMFDGMPYQKQKHVLHDQAKLL